jgi:hypothetical protein
MKKNKGNKSVIVENGILKVYSPSKTITSKEGHREEVFLDQTCQDVIIPRGVHTIGGLKESSDAGRFHHDIFYHPFIYHGDIKSVVMTDEVTVIGEKAFEHCHHLQSITMSKHITEIKINAFLHCEQLTSVDLYPTLKEIHAWAFIGCKALTMIRFHGSYEQWKLIKIGQDAFEPTTMIHTNDGVVYFLPSIQYPSVIKEVKEYQKHLNKKQTRKKK